MRSARFYLKLNPEELLQYYQGLKKFVRVTTYSGFSLQFRAEHLRSLITHEGINGEFEITFDDYNKFQAIRRVSPRGGDKSSNAGEPMHSGRRPRGGFSTSI